VTLENVFKQERGASSEKRPRFWPFLAKFRGDAPRQTWRIHVRGVREVGVRERGRVADAGRDVSGAMG